MNRKAINVPKSRYQQIAEMLISRINDGEYERGSALPSEWELAEQFGVSRVTINKAVSQLRAAGLVRAERGRGVFVRALPRVQRVAQSRYRKQTRESGAGAYDVEMRKLGLEPRHELAIEVQKAPTDVTQRLNLQIGEKVLVRLRRMLASDEATQLAITYVPLNIAKAAKLDQEQTGPGGTYSRLADAGYPVARFTEDIECRIPTDSETQQLDLDAGQPVFQVINTTWTADDNPTSVTYHIMPGYLWNLHYEWENGE